MYVRKYVAYIQKLPITYIVIRFLCYYVTSKYYFPYYFTKANSIDNSYESLFFKKAKYVCTYVFSVVAHAKDKDNK